MAFTTSCNATPPAQQCTAFGLENKKEDRHYLLKRHATCTTVRRIYIVFGLENLKDGRHYLLQRHATCTNQHIFGLDEI